MRVFKCDRCGKIYNEVPEPVNIKLQSNTGDVAMGKLRSPIAINCYGDNISTEIDLCSCCLKDYANWFQNCSFDDSFSITEQHFDLKPGITFNFLRAVELLLEGEKVRVITWAKNEYIYLDKVTKLINDETFRPFNSIAEWAEAVWEIYHKDGENKETK